MTDFGSTWKHLEALGKALEEGNAVNDRWGVRSMTDGKCCKRPMGGAVIDRRSVTEVWVWSTVSDRSLSFVYDHLCGVDGGRCEVKGNAVNDRWEMRSVTDGK